MKKFLILTAFSCLIASQGQAQDRSSLTTLPFPEGFPSQEAAHSLGEELRFQQAVQTYLWAMPAMSLYSMREAQEKQFGSGSNVMAVFKDRINAKTVVLTASPDIVYAFAWLELKRN